MIELEEVRSDTVSIYEEELVLFKYFVGSSYVDAACKPRLYVFAAFLHKSDAESFLQNRKPDNTAMKMFKRK